MTFFISLVLISCKKSGTLELSSARAQKASVGPGQENLVIDQLKWIARGIPDLADPNQPFRQLVENLCFQVPGEFYALNTDIQIDAQTLAIDYENEVFTNVNNRFSPNSYNRSFFFEIEIDGCMNMVGIRIPELDIVNTAQKLVVVPEDPFTNDGDSIYGYYLNDTLASSPPVLDSLLISEDNMDSVYLWVVGLVQSCLDSSFSAGGSGGSETSAAFWWYCDGDGICEPEHGEDETNCPDCQNSYVPLKKLVLREIRSLTDRKKFGSNHPDVKYQEAHLQGKYAVCYTYAIVDHNNLNIKEHRTYHPTPSGSGPYTPPATLFKAWGGNAEMKRCKKNWRGKTKCNRGSSTVKTENAVLSYDFEKNDDAIYFEVFERDDNRKVKDKTISITNASGSMTSILTLEQHSAPGFPYSWTWNNRTGQMEHICEILPNDPNYQWIPDPAGGPGEIMTLTFDGEIEFVLALE